MNSFNLSPNEDCKKRPLSVTSTSSSGSYSDSLRRQCKKHARTLDCPKNYEQFFQSLDLTKSIIERDWNLRKKCQLSCSSSDPTLNTTNLAAVTVARLSQSRNSVLEADARMKAKISLSSKDLDMAGGFMKSMKDDINRNQIRRTIDELCHTEELFVEDIKCIIEGYLKPLSSTVKEMPGNIFGNIVELYNFSSMFLDLLKNCGSVAELCHVFIKNSVGFLEVYSLYCQNYPKALEMIRTYSKDPSIAKYFKILQSQLNHKLPLASYLLKPIQRISKYHLFFQNIAKRCDKCDENIANKALNAMTQILKHIDQAQCICEDEKFHSALHEDIKRMSLTDLGDLIIKDKLLVGSASQSKTYLHIFLFTKAVLIAQKKSKNKFLVKIIFKAKESCIIEDVVPHHPLTFFIMSTSNSRFLYKLQATNPEQKTRWCYNLKRILAPPTDIMVPISELRRHLIENYEENMARKKGEKFEPVRTTYEEEAFMKFDQIYLRNISCDLEQNKSSPLNAMRRTDGCMKFSSVDDDRRATLEFKRISLPNNISGKAVDINCLEKQNSFGINSPLQYSKIINKKRSSKKKVHCNERISPAEAEIISPYNPNYLFTLKMPKVRSGLKDKLMLSYKEAKCNDVVLEGCSGVYRKLPEQLAMPSETPEAEKKKLNLSKTNSYEMLDFFYEDKLLDELERNEFTCEDLNFNEDECFCIKNDTSLLGDHSEEFFLAI